MDKTNRQQRINKVRGGSERVAMSNDVNKMHQKSGNTRQACAMDVWVRRRELLKQIGYND